MSEKKVVSRSTATGLGIMCIILVAGLVGVILYYNTQVNTLNNDKNTLNNDKNALTTYKNQLETWLAGNITQLQDRINSLTSLSEQMTILNQYTVNQGAGAQSNVASWQANYAGYVEVSMTSTTDNAYVTLEYWYQGHFFSFKKNLGTSGQALFCVLPSTVTVYLGNSNWMNGATHTISATYYY